MFAERERPAGPRSRLGFLISGIIFDEVARGGFSIAGFYKRRACRILPAFVATRRDQAGVTGWFGVHRSFGVADKILVLYGSYRADRIGIRLADYLVTRLRSRGAAPDLVDAKAVGLPMLDRMYKEYANGTAPAAMQALAGKIRAADAFVFVTGEYNWSVQPGLKNLTDHFLEEWFWRPAAIASYSAGRLGGVRAGTAWHGVLSEMGMVVVSSTLAVGPIAQALGPTGEPTGEPGAALEHAFGRFADDLGWWTEAARAQRARQAPPY